MKTLKSILKTFIQMLLASIGLIAIIILACYWHQFGDYYRAHNELAQIKYLENIYFNVIPDDDFEDLLLRIPEEHSDDHLYIAKEWLKDQDMLH